MHYERKALHGGSHLENKTWSNSFYTVDSQSKRARIVFDCLLLIACSEFHCDLNNK